MHQVHPHFEPLQLGNFSSEAAQFYIDAFDIRGMRVGKFKNYDMRNHILALFVRSDDGKMRPQ
jgi:hypothetical protein